MKRDMTVIKREAVPGSMGRGMIEITATNYAGDTVELTLEVGDGEQFQVYDVVTVTMEVRK